MKRFLFILIGISLLVGGCSKKDKITYTSVDKEVHEQLIVDFLNYCIDSLNDTKVENKKTIYGDRFNRCNDLLNINENTKIKTIEKIPEHIFKSFSIGYNCTDIDVYCYHVVVFNGYEEEIIKNDKYFAIKDNKIVLKYYDVNKKEYIEEYWTKD